MLKIGLTGGIGSGKSTVSKLLIEKGIPVIDSDSISREIMELYPEVKEKIKIEFGEGYFDENGRLKRRELGNYIFSNPQQRLKLENITLPFIKQEIFRRIKEYKEHGAKLCVVDAPTLIETELYKAMDFNILVWADLQTQVLRVMNRDELKIEDVKNRINSQMPLEVKKNYVNFTIDNGGSMENTKEQLERLLIEIYDFEVEK